MLVTVPGTYHDGVVELDEPLPTTEQEARRVLVVFLEANPTPAPPVQHQFSWQKALTGLQVESPVSVAAEVIAERQERD